MVGDSHTVIVWCHIYIYTFIYNLIYIHFQYSKSKKAGRTIQRRSFNHDSPWLHGPASRALVHEKSYSFKSILVAQTLSTHACFETTKWHIPSNAHFEQPLTPERASELWFHTTISRRRVRKRVARSGCFLQRVQVLVLMLYAVTNENG